MRIHKIHACTGHRAALYALAPGRTPRHFWSAGGDGWVVEWNLDDPETGKLVAAVESPIYAMAGLGEGRVAAGNMNGGVHWLDLGAPESARNVQHHRRGVYDVLPLGDWVFTAGGEGLLTRWDAATARTVESLQLSHQALRSVAHCPQRGQLAVGASDHSIYLLDYETLALKKTLTRAHANSVFAVAYSPDGRYLLSGGRDAVLRVWDAERGFALHSEQPAHWFTINHIAFSPDGQLFATASRDKTLKIWDAADFRLLKVVDTLRHGGHINSVNRLLWLLPDCLVSCSDDRTAALWQVEI